MSDNDASVKIKVTGNINLPFSVLWGMRAGSENQDTRQTFEQAWIMKWKWKKKKSRLPPNKYFDRSKHSMQTCRTRSIRLKIIRSRDSAVTPPIQVIHVGFTRTLAGLKMLCPWTLPAFGCLCPLFSLLPFLFSFLLGLC